MKNNAEKIRELMDSLNEAAGSSSHKKLTKEILRLSKSLSNLSSVVSNDKGFASGDAGNERVLKAALAEIKKVEKAISTLTSKLY